LPIVGVIVPAEIRPMIPARPSAGIVPTAPEAEPLALPPAE